MSTCIYAQASVQGIAHVRLDLPCQDASGIHFDTNSGYGIAIVADGAGSASKSHLGAQFLVDAFLNRFKESLPIMNEIFTMDESAWDLTAKSYATNIHSGLSALANKHKVPLKDLASTLIFTFFSEQRILLAHIGDGRAACKMKGSSWQPIMHPFRGEEVNETVFFSSPIWIEDRTNTYFRTSIIDGDIDAMAILTDGCERASYEVNIFDESLQKFTDPNQPFPHFFDPNINGLKQLHAERKDQESINNIWAQYLKSGNKVLQTENDDKSMVILHFMS